MGNTESFLSHPIYEPEVWNSDPLVRKSHNCYAYAMNVLHPHLANRCAKESRRNTFAQCPKQKPQPGSSDNRRRSKKNVTCKQMEERMKIDVPRIRKLEPGEPVPEGFYRIALFRTERNTGYHFFRQDSSGYWSHKEGSLPVTNRDMLGMKIKDPRYAFPARFLYTFCGFYAVPIQTIHKQVV